MPLSFSNSPLSRLTLFGLRVALTYLGVSIGGILGALVFYRGVEMPAVKDPAAFQQALWIVNAAHALMLTALSARLTVSTRRSAIVLFAVFFGVQGLLTGMETLFFTLNGSLDLSVDLTLRGLGASVVAALGGAWAAALGFHSSTRPSVRQDRARAPAWRILAAIALYPVVYWTAGLLIALPSEAVARFYGATIDAIDPAALLALQVVRGAIWTVLAMVLAGALRGPTPTRAILVGAAFSVFMAAQLLFPTDVMPADVRWVHFVEIVVSNFLYGLAAVWLVDVRRSTGTADA